MKEAKSSYVNAAEIKPKEEYPKQKIKEIDLKLNQLQKEQKYSDAISKADQLYQKGDFENALKEFQTAADLMPNEQYPKDKIAEITALLQKFKEKAKWESFRYHVIVGSFIEPSNATRMNKKMMDQGRSSRIFEINEGRMKAVSYSSYETLKEALSQLPNAKAVVIDDEPWVLIR